jgi:hypothetical protein
MKFCGDKSLTDYHYPSILKNFYLQVWRTLTHLSLNNNKSTELLESAEEWDAIKSKKLNTLAKLVKHHLAQNSATLMKIMDNELVQDASVPPPPASAEGPDKIIVYCAFPSNNELIKTVHFQSSGCDLLTNIAAGFKDSWGQLYQGEQNDEYHAVKSNDQ